MATNDLNPVKPGETPPVASAGAETFPVQPPVVSVPTPLPDQNPVQAASPAEAQQPGLRSVFGAVHTPNIDTQARNEQAETNREKAAWSESFGASLKMNTTADLYRWFTAPDFPKGDADIGALILQVDIPLTEAELEFLHANKSGSVEEHEYRLEHIKNRRQWGQVAGDNMSAALAGGLADGFWLAAGGAGALVANVIKAGRVARMLAGAATDVAVTYGADELVSQVSPIDAQERTINLISAAMFGGAAGLMVRRADGTLGKLDPDFPDKELGDIASTIPPRGTLDDVVLRTDPTTGKDSVVPAPRKPDTPAGARDIPGSVRETPDIPTWDVYYGRVPIPKGSIKQTARQAIRAAMSNTDDLVLKEFLRNFESRLGAAADKMPVYVKDGEIVRGKPGVVGYYDVGGNRLQLQANQPGWVLAHELAHAVTVNKLAYGKKNKDTTIGRITADIQDLYDKVRPALVKEGGLTKYLGSDLEEFVAGIYTRDPKFVEALSKIPDPGNPRRSALGRLVDAVRRLLGFPVGEMNGFLRALQLSEELMDQPLRVIYHRPKGSRHRMVGVEMTRDEAVKASVKEADDTFKEAAKYNEKLAKLGGWNFHKTIARFSPKVADILFDNPLTQNKDSVDSWARSIRADFTAKQRVYEDALRDMLREEGHSFWTYIRSPFEYRAAQRKIERALQRELDYRNNAALNGNPEARGAPGINAKIVDLADKYSDAMDDAFKELVRSGVYGADQAAQMRGYYPHRWSARIMTDIENRLLDAGFEQAAITQSLRDGFSRALRRMNPDWDQELADKVGKAMVDRMARRANQSDADFRGRHIGNAEIATIADMLEGVEYTQRQRILDALAGISDEANRASYLKARLKIDTETPIILPDGSTVRLGDMLEPSLTNLMEHYLDDAAGRAAFARAGMPTATDIAKLRTELTEEMRRKNVADVEIENTLELFDNAIDLLHGRAVGTNFAWGYRMMQAVTQMVGLGAAGIWQITEYAKLLTKYGLMRSLRDFHKSFQFKEHFSKFTPEEAGRLENILSRNAYQDIRLRPMVEKLEDGFNMPTSHAMLWRLQAAKQAVPYMNVMKWIQRHQSNLVGNLVADTLVQGARGNKKYKDILRQYGLDLDDPLMGEIVADIQQFGADTTKWRDGTWDTVRNGLNRMVDDSVLRARRGEIPAFAQVSDLGKFIFTFRSFVLASHNKTLLGTFNRDGVVGLGQLLAYQYPLSYMAVMANNARTGREMDDEELVRTAISMMGGIGLFSEAWGIITGDKQQFGAPGLIAADRAFAAGNAFFSMFREDGGTAGDFGAALFNATPLLSIVPHAQSIQATLKED